MDIFRNVSNTFNDSSLGTYLFNGKGQPQFHVVFDPSLNTINGRDRNIVPPIYWHAMCGFIKRNTSVFVHYEQHDQ